MRRVTRKDIALSLYAAGRTIEQAALATECSPNQVRLWLQEQAEKERENPPEPLYAC